ncbi:MAG TPA: tRNA (adenosine(37)-N6)-threonylcarbamoyltransferase complex dimerization subunit type 1 TsaB [Candidatus Acidoferrales bacterium]|nr:tRNA (adenosine(37)-N6)-threonylcarbamoyltransferase complex dimerization subunit type 1 TsaB [Candidatus Acidoferrales bacterium]
MLLLAVDTAAPTGSLAVMRDAELLGEISTASDEAYSSRLFRQLQFLLRELQIETKDFDVFAVVAGPGSFTGLRVGLTAVKAWAEVFSKPIVAVSGLEAVAAQAHVPNDKAMIVPVLDARRGQIFAGMYRRGDSGLTRAEDERVCTAGELLLQLGRHQSAEFIFVSPNAAILDQLAAKIRASEKSHFAPCKFQSASAVLAPVIARLAMARAARGEFTDALRLDANYIRRSDAELLWKAR